MTVPEIKRKKRLNLAAVLEAMHFNSVAARSVDVMAKGYDHEAVVEAFRGAILALKIDAKRLAAEAKAAVFRLLTPNPLGLFALLPRISVEPNWTLASDAGLDAQKRLRPCF
jgi:hypothetical protein